MKPGLRSVLRDAWRLTWPYFRSEERWSARILLGTILAMNFIIVGLNVLLNSWNGAFFDSLQNKKFDDFINLLLFWRADDQGFMPGWIIIVAVYLPIAIYRTWLTQLLMIRWRRWMTDRTLKDWLSDRAYYTIGLQHIAGQPATDNPDQRIADDIRGFTADTLRLSLNFIKTVVTLVSFAQILWGLSGALTIMGVTIPGYLLFVAILYAIFGTMLTHWVGNPLAGIEFRKQKAEADFRFSLVRVRENAEGIALYAGERSETNGLLKRFAAVVVNWRQYMNRTKYLNALIFVYEQAGGIFPIIVASPRYFSGQITLGGLTRISGAFSQVQSALSWFVDAYAELAVWRATVDRLTGFRNAVAAARALAEGGVRVEQASGSDLALRDVDLALPNGRNLLTGAVLTLPQGRSTVISGRSGSGKSTLFRAMAGLWPFGGGAVERPPGTYLFLPQRPYLPLGTLRQAVTYPSAPDVIGDAEVRQALTDAGLATLIPDLDTEQPWAQRLSGGEQQRLAVARALLLKPDWLFLDEATASLDPEGEADLYQALRTRLPDTTIISIAHRGEVARWHERRLVFSPGSLEDAKTAPSP
jgi:putative ATP-binding cassette transporter